MSKLLEAKHITKVFPGVIALDDVSIDLNEGEVLCLVGENGAGKSTLMKIFSGVYHPDGGEILLNGEPVQITNPLHSLNLGFSIVYQEHKLIPNLSVAENIYFGRMPKVKGLPMLVDFNKLYKDTQEILDVLGLSIHPRQPVHTLNSSQEQMVEIAKAYSCGSKIMILDEPSASITDTELLKLFEVINKLKKEGKSFIYISHRLNELYEIGDRVVVLKDGKFAGEMDIKDTTTDKLISMMVGRELGKVYQPKDRPRGEEVLRVENLTNDKVTDCSLNIHAGEIVGMAGLVGAGRSELAESIFGYRKMKSGKVFFEGKEVHIKSPKDAIRLGMGFVTEDRKTTGVFLGKSVSMNISFAILNRIAKFSFVDAKKERELVDQSIHNLQVKTPTPQQIAGNLSGGNQQKVILAKWLLTNSKLLICDEPTKGIDVGTKQEFYTILDDLARKGIAILVISSELPEVVGLSNRVYVMREGRIVAEIPEERISEEEIANYAMRDEAN